MASLLWAGPAAAFHSRARGGSAARMLTPSSHRRWLGAASIICLALRAASGAQSAVSYDGRIESGHAGSKEVTSLLRQEVATPPLSPVNYSYGNAACQCIGFHNQSGKLYAHGLHSDGQPVELPNGIGSYCHAWDKGVHPQCVGLLASTGLGSLPDWCTKRWCYVDSCACGNGVHKHVATYLGNARWQGRPLEYSYETCEEIDTYTETNHASICLKQASKRECDEKLHCSWSDLDSRCNTKKWEADCTKPLLPRVYGEESCRCIGLSGLSSSTMELIIANKSVSVNADSFSTCQAWDAIYNPLCDQHSTQGAASSPELCGKAWCVVDPCCCKDMQFEMLRYHPHMKFQGKPLYISYDTCGNSFNTGVCYNENTESGCGKWERLCRWDGSRCEPVGVSDDPTCQTKWPENCPANKATDSGRGSASHRRRHAPRSDGDCNGDPCPPTSAN